MSPARAFELGIVDELAAPDELLGTAERWVIEHGRSNQPWDRRGFRIPGGSKLNDMNVGRLFQIQTAKVGAKYRHNYPAPIAALRALFNGTTVNSIDPGLRIETREFSALTRDPVARNIIRTLFINKRERKFRKADADSALLELCEQAYADEAQRMLDQGVTGAVVRNAAWAAGMKDHPTGLETAESESLPEQGSFDFAQLKQRLLAIQSLAAAELWAIEGLDPVIADLSTVLGGGFPSYTGGVMSHISTMGLPEFIALCDKFADEFGGHRTVCEPGPLPSSRYIRIADRSVGQSSLRRCLSSVCRWHHPRFPIPRHRGIGVPAESAFHWVFLRVTIAAHELQGITRH